MSELVIRPAHPGDEARLVDLFRRVYGKPLSEERWRWKLGRWNDAVPNVWVGERDRTPICHYAGMPAAASLEGRESTVMVAVDAMTSPEHRRQGLLKQVVSRAHEAWRRAGIPLVLGLPNEQYHAPSLGWRPLFSLCRVTFPLRPGAILRRRLGSLAALGLGPLATAWFRRHRRSALRAPAFRAREVSRAGPAFDSLWESSWEAARSSIRRDGSWVSWRFLAAPEPGYRVLFLEDGARPLGWSAFRVDRGGGHAAGLIADLVSDPSEPAAWGAVVDATLTALAAEGAETASTLAAEGTARYRRLLEQGFLARPQGFMVHAVALDAGIDVAALGRPAAWDMAGGDFDVI